MGYAATAIELEAERRQEILTASLQPYAARLDDRADAPAADVAGAGAFERVISLSRALLGREAERA